MPRQRTTISDIARAAGVSSGAVSFALNGRPGVSEETRARILRIADEMQWRPNNAARALRDARSDVVGFVIARPARTLGVEPFFAQLISGVQAGLSRSEIALHMLIVEDTEAEIRTYKHWWNEHRVDGWILIDLHENDPRIPVLEAQQMPAILIGGPTEHSNIPAVWTDDREAMMTIMSYLATLGHRRIAHVAGIPGFVHTQRRMAAVQDAIEEFGLESAVSYTTDFSDSQGASITRRILSQRKDRPTAIVYDSDVMAVAGSGVTREMGVSVPDDISIVAFDDSALTSLVYPGITSLTRDTFALGEQVVGALLEIISGKDVALDIAAAAPTLTVRGSTAGPHRHDT
ncbi:LacI family DNA-binding transcriptional regulator [Paeniglutamicibacter terrestris]|jgi:DNA-binding LacI/PurR family transcriptional regulator|uniref:LacI family transcriptional regulator n=1 Tax=Paeniglutamicibacter terrestris TaxID=2723403 RepID=A0ABX1G4Z0_9MICC|nr:LacI family DNA-binding transcriptional regulator [Paeniglutamicibacter terrestris]NKG21333.1 LacI family transcriptional regulator [Paeniglutamicibacter terrestris]